MVPQTTATSFPRTLCQLKKTEPKIGIQPVEHSTKDQNATNNCRTKNGYRNMDIDSGEPTNYYYY